MVLRLLAPILVLIAISGCTAGSHITSPEVPDNGPIVLTDSSVLIRPTYVSRNRGCFEIHFFAEGERTETQRIGDALGYAMQDDPARFITIDDAGGTLPLSPQDRSAPWSPFGFYGCTLYAAPSRVTFTSPPNARAVMYIWTEGRRVKGDWVRITINEPATRELVRQHAEQYAKDHGTRVDPPAITLAPPVTLSITQVPYVYR